MPLVATATVVATAAVAGIAAAIVGTEKNNDDQKDDPAVVTEKVHLFPSLRALTSYYAKGNRWCKKIMI